jgi:hypothetical protein
MAGSAVRAQQEAAMIDKAVIVTGATIDVDVRLCLGVSG